MIDRQPVTQYKPGETFACIKRQFAGEVFTEGKGWETKVSEPCGATIRIHDYHWCAQVCPKCLANYHVGHGTDMGLYLDTAGFYPPDTARLVRAAIGANGGQYVPTFVR